MKRIQEKKRNGRTYALSNLLHGVIAIGAPKVMFTEEDSLGLAVLEADHRVLPVADVIAEADVEDLIAQIVGVKEEPEGIQDAIALFHREHHGRRVAIATFCFDCLGESIAQYAWQGEGGWRFV